MKIKDGTIPSDTRDESAWLQYWSAYARGDEAGMKLAWSQLGLTGPASMRKLTVEYPKGMKGQVK